VLEDYLNKEGKLWDFLVAGTDGLVKSLRKTYPTGNVPTMLFAWPGPNVRADDGTVIRGLIPFAVPAGVDVKAAAVKMAKRTQATALVLVQRQNEYVKVILEAPIGTKCWSLPVRRHGDVTVVEEGSTSMNGESIGVLWQKSRMN